MYPGTARLQSNKECMHCLYGVEVGYPECRLKEPVMFNDYESPCVMCWRDADKAIMGLLSENVTVNRAHNVSKKSTEFGGRE